MKYLDMAGETFNRLTAVQYVRSNARGDAMWSFKCTCGREVILRANNVRAGDTKSCGCLKSEVASSTQKLLKTKHGMHGTRTYRAWSGMIQRCTNPRHTQYKDWGGRGIKVCESWHSFQAFLDDMGPCPSSKHSIDREDNNGHYEPGNCRWATPREQGRNRRSCKLLTVNGETKPQIEWAEQYGLDHKTVSARIARGWSHERAVTTPAFNRGQT